MGLTHVKQYRTLGERCEALENERDRLSNQRRELTNTIRLLKVDLARCRQLLINAQNEVTSYEEKEIERLKKEEAEERVKQSTKQERYEYTVKRVQELLDVILHNSKASELNYENLVVVLIELMRELISTIEIRALGHEVNVSLEPTSLPSPVNQHGVTI